MPETRGEDRSRRTSTHRAAQSPDVHRVILRPAGETGMFKRVFAAIATACVCSTVIEARVTRIEIVKVERVEPTAADAQGANQPYERLSGKVYGELDPADPKNALITDIQLAT